MMIKRDKIFYFACGLSVAGIALFVLGYNFALLFLVAAYLLRPALHEFGLARQYADERQLSIHSRSGNLGFMVVILAAVGLAMWRISRGQSPDELYELIFIGLAAKAISGLVMIGEYRKAGRIIISAVGLFIALFIVAESGLSVASIAGLAIGGAFIGMGQLAGKLPRVTAIVIMAVVIAVILAFGLYDFKGINTALWLFFVVPLVTASVCLFLGSGRREEDVSPRLRAAVFGGLGAGVTIIFILLLVFGGRDQELTTQTLAAPPDQIMEIQGISCAGPVEYYEDGHLASCRLGQEDTLSGQPLPTGTIGTFDTRGIYGLVLPPAKYPYPGPFVPRLRTRIYDRLL